MKKFRKIFLPIILGFMCLCSGIFFLTGDALKETEYSSGAATYTLTITRSDKVTGEVSSFYLHNKTKKTYTQIYNSGTVSLSVSVGDWVYFGIPYNTYSTKSMWLYVEDDILTGSYQYYYGWNEMYFQWAHAGGGSMKIGVYATATSSDVPYLVTYDANGGSLEGANTTSYAGETACKLAGRYYNKKYDGHTLIGYGHANAGWGLPMLVGTTSDAVITYTTGDGHEATQVSTHTVYNGSDYYFSSGQPAMQGCFDWSNENHSYVPLWGHFSKDCGIAFLFDSSWDICEQLAYEFLGFYKDYAFIFSRSAAIRMPTVNPTREGYTFAGWYSANGTTTNSWGTKLTSTTSLTGNKTYYARWTPATYTVTLNPGVGTLSWAGEGAKSKTGNGFYDELFHNDFTRHYYKVDSQPAIAGVYSEPEGWLTPILISTNAEAVAYYCDYCIDDIVGGCHFADYGPNSAYGLCFDQLTGRYYGKLADGWYYYDSGALVSCSPNTKHFIPLYASGLWDGHGVSDYYTYELSNTYYHLMWADDWSMDINWDVKANRVVAGLQFLSEVMGKTDTVSVQYDSRYDTKLPTPIALGYTFQGWWTGNGDNGNWGVKVQTGDKWLTAGNATLYARWLPNNYAVKFNASPEDYEDGGDGTIYGSDGVNAKVNTGFAEFAKLKNVGKSGTIVSLRHGNLNDVREFVLDYASKDVYVALLTRYEDVSEGEVWVSPILFSKCNDFQYSWWSFDGVLGAEEVSWSSNSSFCGSFQWDGETWYYCGGGAARSSAQWFANCVNDYDNLVNIKISGNNTHDAVQNFINGKLKNYQFGKTMILPTPTASRKGYQFEGWWTKDGSVDGDWGVQITNSTPLYFVGGEIVSVYGDLFSCDMESDISYYYDPVEPLELYAKWSTKEARVLVKAGLVGGEEIASCSDVFFNDLSYAEYMLMGSISPYSDYSTITGSEQSFWVACDYDFFVNCVFTKKGYKFVGFNVSTSGYNWNVSYDGYNPPSSFSFTPTMQGGHYYISLVFEREGEGALKYSNGIEYYVSYDKDGAWVRENNGMHYLEHIEGLEIYVNFYVPKVSDVFLWTVGNTDATAFVLDGSKQGVDCSVVGPYYGNKIPYRKMIRSKFENVSVGWHVASITINSYVWLKIDAETDFGQGYFYVEDGLYPQRYVGNELNSYFNNYVRDNGDEYYTNYDLNFDGQTGYVYSYVVDEECYDVVSVVAPTTTTTYANGGLVTFIEGQTYWFEIEPIKWRVTPLGAKVDEIPSMVWGSGTLQLVSDRVLDWSSVHANEQAVVTGGWAYNKSSTWGGKNNQIYQNLQINFDALDEYDYTYISGEEGFKYKGAGKYHFDEISNEGTNVKVKRTYNNSHTGILQASIQDVDKLYQDNYSTLFASDAQYDHFNENLKISNRSAYASDLVVMLSGRANTNVTQFSQYGTRDLFNNQNNFKVNAGGNKTNVWLNNDTGVRFVYGFQKNQERAKLLSGKEFNAKIKTMVANAIVSGTTATFDSADSNVKKIVFDYIDESGTYKDSEFDGDEVTTGYSVDVSASQDGSIKAYLYDRDDGFYNVYVLSSANIYANEDSRYMFLFCYKVNEIEFCNFSTSYATSFYEMFTDCAELQGINIENWDTSNVTDMRDLFWGCSSLPSIDLSGWLVDSVTSGISRMFAGCESLVDLTLPAGFVGGNVSSVTSMFEDCLMLKSIDVSGWDVSGVSASQGMRDMFRGCSALEEIVGIENLNVSAVTDMAGMFYGCSSLRSLDLSKWETDSLTKVSNVDSGLNRTVGMFDTCSALEELKFGDGFKVDNVADLGGFFYGCKSLKTLNLSGWNVSNVASLSAMFSGCNSLESVDLTGWNTSNVDNMYGLFQYCYNLTEIKGLEGFNTAKVTYMNFTFNQCRLLSEMNLTSWDTSKVRGFDGMFYGCSALRSLDLSNFVTSSATHMHQMFYGCWNLTSLDLSHFDMSNVKNVSAMFRGCSSLKNIQMFRGTHSLTTTAEMFNGCSSLARLDVSGLDTANVTDMSRMFRYCETLDELDVSHLNTSNVTTMKFMFQNCSRLAYIDCSNFDTSNVMDMSGMFNSCGGRVVGKAIIIVSGFDTTNVTTMDEMFAWCGAQILDLSSFDTSKVTRMQSMFVAAENLKTIYVSDLWSTESVINSTDMFYGCDELVGGAGTSYDSWGYTDADFAVIDGENGNNGYLSRKVVIVDCQELRETFDDYYDYDGVHACLNMGVSFKDAPTDVTEYCYLDDGETVLLCQDNENGYWWIVSDYEIWLSGNATGLFMPTCDEDSYSWYQDRKLVLGNVNTSLVTNMSHMFHTFGYEAFEIEGLEKLDTSNVTDMSYMFAGVCDILDLSNFDTSKVTTMRGMFEGRDISEPLDLSSFDTSNVIDMAYMFSDNRYLKQIFVGEKWATANVTSSAGMFSVDGDWGYGYLYGEKGTRWQSSKADDKTFAKIDGGTASPGYLSSHETYSMLIDGEAFNQVLQDIYETFGSWQEYYVFDYYQFYNSFLWDFPNDYEYNYDVVNDSAEYEENYGSGNSHVFDVSLAQDGSIKLYVVNEYSSIFILSYDEIYANYDCSYMFSNARFSGCVYGPQFNNFNTSLTENMECMFYEAEDLSVLDLSNFDTSSVQNISWMFEGCDYLETIYASEWWRLSGGIFDEYPSMSAFYDNYALVGGSGYRYDYDYMDGWEYARIDGGSMYADGYFTYKPHK